jgi:hypothetical protein
VVRELFEQAFEGVDVGGRGEGRGGLEGRSDGGRGCRLSGGLSVGHARSGVNGEGVRALHIRGEFHSNSQTHIITGKLKLLSSYASCIRCN